MGNGGLALYILNLGTGLWRAENFTDRYDVPLGKEAPITAGGYQNWSALFIAQYNSASLPGTKPQPPKSGQLRHRTVRSGPALSDHRTDIIIGLCVLHTSRKNLPHLPFLCSSVLKLHNCYFVFIPCISNNCFLYTNICTNKWCKFILKLLRHVSVLIHHLQGVYCCVS